MNVQIKSCVHILAYLLILFLLPVMMLGHQIDINFTICIGYSIRPKLLVLEKKNVKN